MSRPRTPVVIGLGRRVGASTVSCGLHACDGDQHATAADIVVCAGGDGVAAAEALAVPPGGAAPVLAVVGSAPGPARLRALEGRFHAVVVLPHVEGWAGLAGPAPEVAGLLGQPFERLPRSLQGYAGALREITTAVVRSGLLARPTPPTVVRPRRVELWRGLAPVQRSAPVRPVLLAAPVLMARPAVSPAVTVGTTTILWPAPDPAARTSEGDRPDPLAAPDELDDDALEAAALEAAEPGCTAPGAAEPEAAEPQAAEPQAAGLAPATGGSVTDAPPALSRLLTPALAALAGVLLLALPARAADPPASTSGVNEATLPQPARALLPLIVDLTTERCPELPPVWVVAQVQAESGWDGGLHSDGPGGPAGLYQFGQQNWLAAGGPRWSADPPGPDDPVLDPKAHLTVAVPWVCANLRAVTAHLKATHKATAPLDAMLVCHIAGCGRVTDSRTGVPAAGEAGCGERCAQVIGRYIAAVHSNLRRFTAPAAPPPREPTPAPRAAPGPTPWTGGATGCRPPDPTGDDGCLTGATRHGLEAVGAAFGGWSKGPVIHTAGCWDAHAWNPRSDHATGKACDFMVTAPGTFAKGAELDNGWKVARWLRAHAGPLQVKYLIWQGRYWDGKDDPGSWGVRYTGGGVYDVRDATGGHYDHVHVSFRE